MIKNSIKNLRLRKGLTQRELAEKAKTSQQQVQRIESGSQAARLDLAERLATALDCSLQELFPDLEGSASSRGLQRDESDKEDRLAKMGIEVDPSLHTINLNLKGGRSFDFFVDAREVSRVRRCLLSDFDNEFLVFDTLSHRVAVNYKSITFSQLLFDPFVEPPEVEVGEDEGMKIWFDDGGEPLEIAVDPDYDSDVEEPGNLQSVFVDLEMPYSEEKQVLFVDEDGEEVILIRSNLAMLSVPLELVSAELMKAKEDGLEEEGAL